MISIQGLYSAAIEIAFQFVAVLPIKKNKIVFDNFGGRGYGCDPKYIAQELLKRKESLDLVWLTKNMETDLPKGIRPVKYGSLKAMYELATASIWIDNIKNAVRVPKKKKQFYIQTWHSSLGLKGNEQDADHLPKTYVNRSKKDAAKTDLMYSNNAFRAEKYSNRFWYNGEVIRCGHHRNTILLHVPEGLHEKVRTHFGINEKKKIMLYAPTFRRKENLDVYQYDITKCLKNLEQKFGGEYICLLRLHPNSAAYASRMNLNDFILDATGYPDMQELLAVADVLITDYSGTMFEFMLTKRPVFLFMQDLKRYLEKERDLYFSFEELPFSVAENETELCNNILQFDTEAYLKDCDTFMERIDMKDDGYGAQKIADIILEHISSL